MELHVFPIRFPPPTSLSTRFLWVFPVHQARALVSCIPPGLVICFTIEEEGLGQGARTSVLSAGLLKKEPVVQP